MLRLFIVSLLCFFTVTNNAQWYPQQSPVSENLVSVSFIDENNGWIVGEYGTILHTTNSGDDWEIQFSNREYIFYGVSFCDTSTGWVVGDFGIILKTTNSGVDWERVFYDTSSVNRKTKVQCATPSTVILLGDMFTGDFHQDTRLSKSTDGGISWEDISPPETENLGGFIMDFGFTTEKIGWACGFGGSPNGYQIHHTTDGGLNWDTKHFNYPTIGRMEKITFKDTLECWATDCDTLYYTSDGGEIWNVTSVPNFRNLTDIVILGDIGYASKFGEKIKKTTDYGINWVEQSTASENTVLDIEFITKDIGWVVGEHGVIYKTINGGITSVNETKQNINSYNLYQNYPNPFNPNTTISYCIPKESFVKLLVFNSLGQLVKTLVDVEAQYPGEYKINFIAEDLTSGVYYYQLNAENISVTKKFILLK